MIIERRNSKRGTSERRMGPVGSDNWHAMLDGAEAVLRDEGHAALTSRRIAERIGMRRIGTTWDEEVGDVYLFAAERNI